MPISRHPVENALDNGIPKSQFMVTIKVERSDGQFASSTRMVPSNLMDGGDHDLDQDTATRWVGGGFAEAYVRCAGLAE